MTTKEEKTTPVTTNEDKTTPVVTLEGIEFTELVPEARHISKEVLKRFLTKLFSKEALESKDLLARKIRSNSKKIQSVFAFIVDKLCTHSRQVYELYAYATKIAPLLTALTYIRKDAKDIAVPTNNGHTEHGRYAPEFYNLMVSIKPEDQVITTKSGVTLKLADIDPTFVACLRNKADEVAKIARQLSKKRTREIEDDDEDIIAESAPSVMALSDTDFGTVRLAHALFDFAIANAAAPQTAWKVIEKMCKTWTATIFPKLSTSLLGAHDAHSGEACLLVAIKTAMFNGDLGEPNSLHAKAFSHLCEHLSRIFDDYEFEKHGDCCHEGNGCHSIVLANGAISILSIALRISTEITGDHQRNNDLLNLLTSGDYKSKLPSGETIEEITACVNSTNWVSNAEKEFGKRTSVWMTIISIIASSSKYRWDCW